MGNFSRGTKAKPGGNKGHGLSDLRVVPGLDCIRLVTGTHCLLQSYIIVDIYIIKLTCENFIIKDGSSFFDIMPKIWSD